MTLPEALRLADERARAKERLALARYQEALEEGDDVAPLWKAVESARSGILAVHGRIQRQAKAQADLLYPEAAPLKEIQAALRPDEAMVVYATKLALVVGPKTARVVKIDDVEKACKAFQRAVTRPDERGVAAPPHESFRYLAKRLRKLVVKPLGLGEEVRRVLVSPEGLLSYVPFAALFEGREVVYVPSGTTYTKLPRGLKGKQVLALGDPDYSAPRDKRAQGIYHPGADLAPLPESRKEAKAIGDVVLLGKQATIAGLRDALGKQEHWRAVHLACHGLMNPERPVLSSLALADDFLKCLDVYRMKIPADLVVLSACETGKGKVYKAEGVIGFTRAFMFAGAPRVMVSLWKVDDEATRALMVKFYELWKTDMAAATALRKAQQHVASQPKWKHPYFWAAWQLWGLPQ